MNPDPPGTEHLPLSSQVETLKRLSLENKAMAKFVSGVSHALSASPGKAAGCPGVLARMDQLPPLVSAQSRPGPAGDLQPTASARSVFRQLNNNSCCEEQEERRKEEKEEGEDEVESLRSLLRVRS